MNNESDGSGDLDNTGEVSNEQTKHLKSKKKPEKKPITHFNEGLEAEDRRIRKDKAETREAEATAREAEAKADEAEAKAKIADDDAKAKLDEQKATVDKIKMETDILRQQNALEKVNFATRATCALSGSIMVVAGCVDFLVDPFPFVGTKALAFGSGLVAIAITGKKPPKSKE